MGDGWIPIYINSGIQSRIEAENSAPDFIQNIWAEPIMGGQWGFYRL